MFHCKFPLERIVAKLAIAAMTTRTSVNVKTDRPEEHYRRANTFTYFTSIALDIGVILPDLKDPTKMVGKAENFILCPDADYEFIGRLKAPYV
jgi:hypothetical protein